MNRYYPAGVIFHNMILGLPFMAGRRSVNANSKSSVKVWDNV